MTKLQKISETILNIYDKNDFIEILANSKLEYQCDIAWSYKFENSKICVDFYQDETGKNHIENFGIFVKKLWIELKPTTEQTRLMFEKLNATPYREVELEATSEYPPNWYDYYGVQPSNFY